MSKELIEQLAKEAGIESHPIHGGLIVRHSNGSWIDITTQLEAFAKAYQAAAPIDNVAEALLKTAALNAANLMAQKCFDISEKYPNEKITARICAIHYPPIIEEAIHALTPDTQANVQSNAEGVE